MQQRVAVIGGGPAGLSAALTAAEKGLAVTLWEAGHIGENINCAEGFFDSLRLLQPPENGIRYRVKKIILECEEMVQLDSSQFNLWMLDRQKWQQALAGEALSRGVEIREKQRLTVRELDDLQNRFDWVLDASGIPPLSSLKYHFREIYQKEALITVQYIINGDFSAWDRALKVVLFADTPGYGWIFPRDRGSANVGLGVFNISPLKPLKGKELYQRLDCFIKQQDIKGEIKSRAAGICPNRRPEWIVRDNLFLLGDAAGLTSPLHGGGIDLACLSGRLAVEAITAGEADIYPERIKRQILHRLMLEEELRGIWLGDYSLISRFAKLFAERKRIDKLLLAFLANPGYFIKLLPLLKRFSSVYLK